MLRAMSVIRLLSETTANRIAAGEVVERPAAVVKELAENALDAGATRIAVTIEEGGSGRILVEDDGIGMSAEELALAIQRHATSKLPEEDTLFAIATLGFRGEALPSIGAVSRLTITSRQRGGDAHAIMVEGGRVGAVMPAAAPPGTRVEMRDLFFATPARRKFLKAPRTEAEHALEALRRLALAWPQVAFHATVDGRVSINLPAADRDSRIKAVLGPDFAANALPVAWEGGTMTLSGLIAQPAHSRATAAEQHLVVNHRPVRDQMLRAALRVAYRDVMEAGRHPVAALYIEVPPDAVDVNVHPMKTELRFRDAGAVRGAMISALRRALGVGVTEVVEAAAPRPALQGWRPAAPAQLSHSWAARGFQEAGLDLLPPPPAPVASPSLPMGFAAEAPPAGPLGRAIGQVLECYILAEAADGALVLVDQHAAHERLTHERLSAQLVEGGVRAQPLLLPAVVDLPPADAARLTEVAPELAKLGLEIESFGAGAMLVRALPALLGKADPAPLLRDMAAEIAEWGEDTALTRKLDAAVARLACHGSIRSGRRLTLPEMDALLRAMEATPRAATCSHGRPTFLRFQRADFERLFGRA
ncbi:DNA mismatch repair endonuclease MutL [Rhodovarius crocodyli]|uniref:DNA mismatch repair protein MutL n=2 Tax=Rhodovarius crocodyli TaxID=1979269 RepID=A0A437LVZ6_9PROT|nr:DNA mismatch repair endonuclease MutL [Rhodovarius crocodyli]